MHKNQKILLIVAGVVLAIGVVGAAIYFSTSGTLFKGTVDDLNLNKTISCNGSPNPATTGSPVTWSINVQGYEDTLKYYNVEKYCIGGGSGECNYGPTITKTYETGMKSPITVTPKVYFKKIDSPEKLEFYGTECSIDIKEPQKFGTFKDFQNVQLVDNYQKPNDLKEEPAELPPLSCSPDKTSAIVGETVTWTAVVDMSGFNHPTFTWTSAEAVSETEDPTGKLKYEKAGVKTASVNVEIDTMKPKGEINQDCAGTVTVTAAPTAEPPPPPPPDKKTEPPPLPPPPPPDKKITPPTPPPAPTPTTTKPTATPTPATTQPAPEILTCAADSQILVPANKVPIRVDCDLTQKAIVTAQIVKGTYDPAQQLAESAIVKNLLLNTSKDAKPFFVTWDGADKYDAKVEEGDYTFLVSAKLTTQGSSDYSIQKFKVVSKAPSAPVAAAPAPAPAPTPAVPAQPPMPTPAAPTPPAATIAQPSQCPGVNYPSDIAGHWAESFIRAAYDACLLSGYPDGTFQPNQPVSRAESVKMVMVGAGIQPKQGCYTANCGAGQPNNIFQDIYDMWQGPWVRVASDEKIVEGYGRGIFRPNNTITRAEAAALIARAFGVPPHSGCYTANCGAGHPNNFFLDIVDSWQGPWIRALWDRGWFTGTAPYTAEPNRPMTRAELTKLMMTARGLK